MNSKTELSTIENHYINFHITYTSTDLAWLQFIKKRIKSEPLLIYIHEDTIICFVDPMIFQEILGKWNNYMRFCSSKPLFHIRFIKYSQDLKEIIEYWYFHIKDLEVSIDFDGNSYNILLNAPKKFRKFLIGKHGKEIEMLVSFLENCIVGNFQYSLKIN